MEAIPVAYARRIYNPVQQDAVVFLKTSEETGGEYTLVEVELADSGGVQMHYHTDITETFTAVEGEVEIVAAKKIHRLRDGQSASASPHVRHLFRNRSGAPCKFLVEIRPGHRGFEETLQIGYGLARDGHCRKNGMPKDRLALSWLFERSGSRLPGALSVMEGLLRRGAKKARRRGIDRALAERYVRF